MVLDSSERFWQVHSNKAFQNRHNSLRDLSVGNKHNSLRDLSAEKSCSGEMRFNGHQ